MRILKFGTVLMSVLMAMLLSSAGQLAFAGTDRPMTPEVAARRENVRQQQAKRITDKQRKEAAAALRAQRIKIYQAKKLVNPAATGSIDTKKPANP